MTKLIYHHPGGSPNTSPFDDAILRVAEQGDVKIVSPYIGISYLQRIINVSGDWVLISDIEAWLSSLSFRARPRAWSFIRVNLKRIHHCPAIHAKTVIGESLAMLGSANITNTGILGRTEMGVLLEDPYLVNELHEWFDSLWDQTEPPIVDEASAFVQWLDNEAFQQATAKGKRQALTSSSQRVRAKLAKIEVITKTLVEKTLDLGSLARSLVVEEQRHYDSLAESVASSVNELASQGFSFGEFVIRVQTKAGKQSIREIYFALLPHCANHVRSVFADGTINRLILVDGKFIQSNAELIIQQLAPFDDFLSCLVGNLEFDESRELLHVTKMERLTGIRPIDQEQLVTELLECAFIDLIDIPGDLPQYKLLDDFEWSGRYRLFSKAFHDWSIAKHSPKRVTYHSDTAEIKDASASSGSGMMPWSELSQRLNSLGQKSEAVDRKLKVLKLADKRKVSDKVFSTLANMVVQQGYSMSYQNMISLVVAIQKQTNGKQKVIANILAGKLSEIPYVFSVNFEEESPLPCKVSLRAVNFEQLSGLPLTIDALSTLNAQ